MLKFKGQRSVGSERRVETNGQTDGRTEASALPPTLMRSELLIAEFYRGRNAMPSEIHCCLGSWCIVLCISAYCHINNFFYSYYQSGFVLTFCIYVY